MAPLEFRLLRYQRERSGGINTFERERVYFTPIDPSSFWLVFLENRSYAGFDTENEAREAVALWKAHWPGAIGKTFTILPRLS